LLRRPSDFTGEDRGSGAHGLIIRDRDGRLSKLQDLARDRWAAGPARLTDDELDDRRYRLTALLDDLANEAGPADRAAIAAAVFTDVADLALVSRGLWSGVGRWLSRWLREIDNDPQREAGRGAASRCPG
jgi:hypothetical protein